MLTRRLDRSETRAFRAATSLDLPAAIQSLQRLRCERDHPARFGRRRQDHVDAAGGRADLDVRKQRGPLLGAQLTEASRRYHDQRWREIGEPAPEVDHERLKGTAAELLGDRAAFRRLDSSQVLIEEKHVRVMSGEE